MLYRKDLYWWVALKMDKAAQEKKSRRFASAQMGRTLHKPSRRGNASSNGQISLTITDHLYSMLGTGLAPTFRQDFVDFAHILELRFHFEWPEALKCFKNRLE